jgi:hypothetical protein
MTTRYKINLKFKALCVEASLAGTVDVVQLGPPMPGRVRLTVLSQKENGMLTFKMTLPPGSAPDVVTQELTVTVAGGVPVLNTVPVAQTELSDPGFVGNDADPVSTDLVNIDGRGNRSPIHHQDLVLVDDQAPGEPGDVGLVVTGQT